MSAEDAVAKLHCGADLVQLYTGLIYRGPALVGECAAARRRFARSGRRMTHAATMSGPAGDPAHPTPAVPVVLSTINARYQHASLGLRYLFANAGDLQSKMSIVELVCGRPTEELAAADSGAPAAHHRIRRVHLERGRDDRADTSYQDDWHRR